MRFFNILILTLVMGFSLTAQTLFENDSADQSKSAVRITSSTSKKQTTGAVKNSSKDKRYILTNLESLILRGDMQFFYEVPHASGWSSVLYVHANPQSEFNNTTGSMGVLGGGRMYLEEKLFNSDTFIQGLMGFNHYSTWGLMIALEFGQRVKWKKNVFLDVALGIDRSYDSERKDPMAYLKLNLSFGLNKPILPFL